MGKSKAKNFKLKQYKVPSTKWVVLVNAWGFDGQYTQAKFNQICVWFEFLFRAEYPKFARVKTLYYQRTHHNFIIELPKEIEGIERYLGAYHDQAFLKELPAIHKPGLKVVLLYEYKYPSFGDPASKNWTEAYPSYTSKEIPPKIPLKSIFDPPLPAPPPPIDVPYALPCPPRVAGIIYGPPKEQPTPSVFPPNPIVEGGILSAKLATPTEMTRNTASSSVVPYQNMRTPDQSQPQMAASARPSDRPDHEIITPPHPTHQKADPYEGDDDAQQFLQGLSRQTDDTDDFLEGPVLPNDPDTSPKQQYRDVSEPVEFPGSEDGDNDDYEPLAEIEAAAAELLALMAAPPIEPEQVKREPEDTSMPTSNQNLDYGRDNHSSKESYYNRQLEYGRSASGSRHLSRDRETRRDRGSNPSQPRWGHDSRSDRRINGPHDRKPIPYFDRYNSRDDRSPHQRRSRSRSPPRQPKVEGNYGRR